MPESEKEERFDSFARVRDGVKLARVVHRGTRLILSTNYLVYCYLINSSERVANFLRWQKLIPFINRY